MRCMNVVLPEPAIPIQIMAHGGCCGVEVKEAIVCGCVRQRTAEACSGGDVGVARKCMGTGLSIPWSLNALETSIYIVEVARCVCISETSRPNFCLNLGL